MRKFLSHLMSLLVLVALAVPASAQNVATKTAANAQVAVQENLPEGTMLVRDEGAKDVMQAPKQIPGLIFKDRVSNYAQFRAAQEQAPVFAPPVDGSFYGLLKGTLSGTIDSGIYEYPLAAPFSYEPVKTGTGFVFQGGCMISEDQFFYTNYTQSSGSVSGVTAGVMNLNTWEVEKTGSGYDFWAQAFAYDKESGRVYGCFASVDGTSLSRGFGYCDLETMTVTIVEPGAYFSGLGQAKDGTFYWVKYDGSFGTIDKNTGAMTTITTSAPTSQYGCSGTIDPNSNTFYWATLNDEPQAAQLWSIDLTTGEGSLVYNRTEGAQLYGLLFPFPQAEAKAPGKPTIDSIEHDGFSLSGVIKFTAPSTYFDGSEPAKGEIMNYRILANGQQIAYGTKIEYGKSYSVSITVPAAGLYEFKVILTNATGDSPAAIGKKFVGEDAPAAPANVVAAYNAGTMAITWDAVTEGANGGQFDGTVTYEVYDVIEDELLAEGLTRPAYEIAMEAPEARTNFQYAVVAVVKGKDSEPGYSNIVTLGDILAPWDCAFAEADDVDGWTIIDANEDAKTWTFNASGWMRVAYNSSLAMDDWLISPAIVVEANNIYEVSLDACSYSTSWPERIAIYWGTEPTVEAMTNVLVEPIVLNHSTFETLSGQLMPEAKGKIYVGIHGCSDKDKFYLDVKNFSISAGVFGLVPAPATDVNAVVSYTGEKHATISYKSPTTVVSGDEINEDTQLTKVEIYVKGELQYFDNAPIAGAVSHFTYDAPYDGYYDFQVIAYNKYGAGMPADLNVFIGINTPGSPLNAQAVEVSDGVVDITWDAPETDIDGSIINPAFVTYTVVKPTADDDFEIIAEGITATEVRGYQVCEAGQQEFANFEIYAESIYGMNETPATTTLAAYGTPYASPFIETFANGEFAHEFAFGSNGRLSAYIGTDSSFTDLQSRNGDNGFLYFQNLLPGWGIQGIFMIETGKVAITDEDAVVEYYTVNPGVNNQFQVVVLCDGESTVVDNHYTSADPSMEWTRVQVPVGQYAGKTVQVQFYIVSTDIAIFDDIRIGKPLQKDLKADDIKAPAVVNTEKEFDVEFTISNFGAAKVNANEYSVALYSEGDLVETLNKDLPALAPGESYTGKFTLPAFDLFMTGSLSYNYEIVYAADEDQLNNSSKFAYVSVVNNNLPTVNLTGELNAAGNAALAWDTPAIDITDGAEQTEDFESSTYPAFSYTSFGDWTLACGNTSATGYYSGATFPNKGYVGGWILFDAESEDMLDSEYYAPVDDGKCYLAAFYHNDGASNDAWLISPALTGVAQTISFDAKCITTNYGDETVACYYSMSGIATSDFIEVESIEGYDGALTTEWKTYSFDIPEGAKYFAIVSTSEDQLATLLDNVSFIGGGSAFSDLELTGYKIYRDEELLASVGVAVNKYVDATASVGPHYYNVTAVYNDGQSAPSNTVKLTKQSTTSLEAVDAASAVVVEAKEIVVTGAETVVIASVDGKVVYEGAGDARVAVATGVYLVKTNDQVVKVVVK